MIIREHDFTNAAETLESYKTAKSVIVSDINGKEIFKDGRGYEPIEINEIPIDAINALVATEDVSFWNHIGINPFSMIYAIWQNIQNKKIVRGGSTITQQLAKGLLYDRDRTISKKKTERKIKEVMLALRIEKKYKKNKIMEAYLNRVYFGRGAYGISSAAKAFFGKQVEALTLFECAYLVGLIQKPSLYTGNPKLALERAKHVLKRMKKIGHISANLNFDDLEKLIVLKPIKSFGEDVFGEWIVRQIPKEILSSNGCIYVKTTLDFELQKSFFGIIPEIKKNSRVEVEELGFLCCDRTGGIRVMIGSANPAIRGLNRCIQPRQAGSIFKIYIYLLAFINGMVPEQIIDDAPFAIGDWTPSNYLHEAIGSIFLKDAFAESVNSVTIFLVKKYGLSRLINLARQFGVSGHMENDMSISLGSACITLLQLAQTILIVMNDGYQVAPYGILEIKDAEGKVIWAKDFSLPEKIKDNEHAFWHMKETMLHTIQSPRGTGRMAKVPGVKRAGKTGTSGNGKCPNDLWFACFEEEMLCCTWFGKDDGSMMQKGAGQKNPAVLAVKEFMSKADGKAISKSVKKIIADSPKSSSMETLLDLPEVFQDPFSI